MSKKLDVAKRKDIKERGNLMEAKQFDQLMQKLDGLIRIVALSSMRDFTSTEKIALLNRAGFSPKEIAEIIGTTQNVVNVRLSEMRKREAKR